MDDSLKNLVQKSVVPNIFIDTSYAIYYNCFSSFSWYQKEFHPVVTEDFDPIRDDEFKCHFEDQFMKKILYAVSIAYPLIDRRKICFCMDCKRTKIWRNDYFPQYKINRKDIKRQFDISGTFYHARNLLIPKIVAEYPAKILQVDGAEGDDVIATLVHYKKDEANVVIASDKDLLQLTHHAAVINLNGEPLEFPEGISDVKKFVHLKAIMGDKGDNINSIFPRCGPKTAMNLLNDMKALKEVFMNKPEAFETYKRNLTLVDLTKIPIEIQEKIIKEFRG